MITFDDNDKYVEYLKVKQADNYRFAIYGAGAYSIEVIKSMKKIIDITLIIDKDTSKCNKEIVSIDVIHIDEFLNLREKFIVIYGLHDFRHCESVKASLSGRKYETILVDNLLTYNNVLRFLDMKISQSKELLQHYNKIQCITEKSYNKISPSFEKKSDVTYLKDIKSENLNIINGIRVTKKPLFLEENCNTIRVFGDSRFFNGEKDEYTVPSFLQEYVDGHYIVENHAMVSSSFWEIKNRIKTLKFTEGDVAVIGSTLSWVPDKNFYESFSEKQIAYIYMKPVLEIKKYLDDRNIKMIFVYTPSIKEINNYGVFENLIVKAVNGIDSHIYPQFGKTANKKEWIKIIPKLENITSICNVNQIVFCDLITKFNEKNFDAFIDANHFSTLGSKAVAKYISEIVFFDKVDSELDYADIVENYTNKINFLRYFNNK